ncbi:MAG: phosphate acyltransferase [Chloroflexi bacterium]|nr:phosphate acyltransferase [Chloroflexota bacterium]
MKHRTLRIALDGMGSDDYPYPELHGALTAASEFGYEILITGDKALLAPALKEINSTSNSKISIIHAPEKIESDESPAFSSRKKTQNSIAAGMRLVKDGEADAFVSAGNTGAILANGLITLRRIPYTRRPAIAVLIPVPQGYFILLDVGANSDCKADFLHQFAIMGSLYAHKVLGIRQPKVGLLSNGEEENKGNELTKEAHALIKNDQNINFIGNVEGKEMFAGKADVVITDGFTGNVSLKITESVAKMVATLVKDAIKSNIISLIGGILVRKSIENTAHTLDPNEHGGAPLLGLNGIVVVGHGRSNSRAIRSAIKVAGKAVKNELLGELETALEQQTKSYS